MTQDQDNNKHDVLTPKQVEFVLAWSGDLTAAARAAGYSHPAVAAAKLMANPAVAAAIRRK